MTFRRTGIQIREASRPPIEHCRLPVRVSATAIGPEN
jgi:hypothetical protein